MIKYRIPEKLESEINNLERLLTEFNQGIVKPQEFKANRVPFGVYEQRKQGTYMVRTRCAASIITPDQLEETALLSKQYGNDLLHITTRQELQIHQVKLDRIVPVIRGLKKTNLATRGGGGNTVRNITCPEDAGIDPDEVFDVTPYAVALTNLLISEDDSWTLPRKFKISFSGSSLDKGYATIADVGFIAALKNGERGFRVFVGGGLGAKPGYGVVLLDFIPADRIYDITKAVKNFFWKHGNRKNKHAARLRFLLKKSGEEEFKRMILEEYEKVKSENLPSLTIEEITNQAVDPGIDIEEPVDHADFLSWKQRFVSYQKQPGAVSILIPVKLGFIHNDDALKLAIFLKPFGENVIRMTKAQNFFLRNIPESHLGNLYNFLGKNIQGFNQPFIYDRIVACAGASTCQLGICLSRGLAEAIMEELERSGSELDRLSDVKMNISGCPNSCGQHQVSDIGFYGRAIRNGEKLYPAYTVVAGAVISENKTLYARPVAEISALDLPKYAREVFEAYLAESSKYGSFRDYIATPVGWETLASIAQKYKDIPSFSQDKNYYYDWGAEEQFSLAGIGAGECSAGLFDLIEVDQKNILEISEKIAVADGDEAAAGLIRQLVIYSSRMLLVTRGVQPQTERDILESFNTEFIKTGLIGEGFQNIVFASKDNEVSKLIDGKSQALELGKAVITLYESMDNSFQFEKKDKNPEDNEQSSTPAPSQDVQPLVIKDLRGVACPMNFVKTKMELSMIKPGEILRILLDDGAPVENVPGSVRGEGHTILDQKRTGDHWTVTIRKEG